MKIFLETLIFLFNTYIDDNNVSFIFLTLKNPKFKKSKKMKFQFVELNRCTTATPIIAATIICRNNNTRHPVLQVDSIGTQLCPPIIQLPITANTSTIITTIQVNNIQQLQQLQNGNSNMQQQYATFAANGICMLLLSTCPKHCFFLLVANELKMNILTKPVNPL